MDVTKTKMWARLITQWEKVGVIKFVNGCC